MTDSPAEISQAWTDHLATVRAQSPDDAAREEGRSAVRTAILRMARAAGEEIREQPVWPGSALTAERPGAAAGIRFALMLRASADFEVGQHVRRARQEGLTWTQIGEILDPALWGITASGGDAYNLAVKAFEYVTDPGNHDRFDTLSFPWDCPACGATVSDRGPYDSHPADSEPGHAEDCTRLTAAIAAYEASWDDEDGD
jgi:hypothetical protein